MNVNLRPWNKNDLDNLVKYADNKMIADNLTNKFPHPYTEESLGYWLAESYWGKGIITQAIRAIVDYGFETFEIDRIFARPFGSNIASQKVLEKVGFILEARLIKTIWKNGRYEDELIYAKRRK